MDHALLVGVPQGVGHGGDERGGLASRWAINRQLLPQGDALHEVAHQVRETVLLADLVDRHDAGMPQSGHAACLPQETVEVFSARQTTQTWDLDRHDPVQFGIAGFVDATEGTDPNLGEQLEPAEFARIRGWERGLSLWGRTTVPFVGLSLFRFKGRTTGGTHDIPRG